MGHITIEILNRFIIIQSKRKRQTHGNVGAQSRGSKKDSRAAVTEWQLGFLFGMEGQHMTWRRAQTGRWLRTAVRGIGSGLCVLVLGTSLVSANEAPVVDAGPDFPQTITITLSEAQQYQLPGSASDDGLPNPPGLLTTRWNKRSGPPGVIVGIGGSHAGEVAPTVSFPQTGTYVLRLRATDSALSASDDVTIYVIPDPVNQPPTVSAGEDQTLGWNIVATLEGSASDPDGDPLTVTWSEISGPGPVEGVPIVKFSNPASATTTALFPLPGTDVPYVLRLTANDGEYEVSDEVTIEVPKNYAIGGVINVTQADLDHVDEFAEEVARIKDELGISLLGQSFPDSYGDDVPEDVWEAYLDVVRDAGGKLVVWFEEEASWPKCEAACQAEGDWELGIGGQFLQWMNDEYSQQPGGVHPALYAYFLIDEPYHEKHGLIDEEPGEYVVTSARLQHLYQQAKAIAPNVPFHVNFSKEITKGDDLCLANDPESYPECDYEYQFVPGVCETCATSALEFRQNLPEEGAAEPTYLRDEMIHNHIVARKTVKRETPAIAAYSSVQVFGDDDSDTYTYYMPNTEDLQDMLDVLRCPGHPDGYDCLQVIDPEDLEPPYASMGDADVPDLGVLGFQKWDGGPSDLSDPEYANLRDVAKQAITGQEAPIVYACPEANVPLEGEEAGLCPVQSTTLPIPAMLDATVVYGDPDDLGSRYSGSMALPEPLEATWSVVESRGTVTFDDEHALSTPVHFELGDTDNFILRLTVSDGLLSTSHDVEIDVPKDDVAPTGVKINTINGVPAADGQIVSDTITVAAEASDDVGITLVEFQVDGNVQEARSVDTLTTWSTDLPDEGPFVWDTTGQIEGEPYNLKVRAYDAEGNALSSDVIKVTVSNDIPVVTIDNPQEGDAVPQPTKTISVTALDSGEIATVAVYGVDEDNNRSLIAISSDPLANPLIWTTSALAQGSFHTLTAEATDVTGKTGISPPVTVKIKDTENPYNVTISISDEQLYGDDNDIVTGTVTIQGLAEDNVGIEKIELLVEGNPASGCIDMPDCVATEFPYEFQWDSTTIADGSDITLKVKAYDTSGRSDRSSGINVTVSNDIPTVTITQPAEGDFIRDTDENGLTTIRVSADDTGGIDKIEFLVDGGYVGYTETSTFDWDISGLAEGSSHTIEARATDVTGKYGFAIPVTVTVDTVEPSEVVIASPAAGSTVSGNISVQAAAIDLGGIGTYEFFIDGAWQGAQAASSIEWDTTSVLDGPGHTLRVKVTDLAGNTTTSDTITVIVSNDITPPTVNFISPAAGSSFAPGEDIPMEASVTDAVGVERVEFYADDGDNAYLLCTERITPYTCTGTMPGGPSGSSYTLEAKAYDFAGNEGADSMIITTE